MAVRKAVATGNWSAVGTWDGGASLPGNGDTVYANGFVVTIDQNVTIGGANNVSVNAGSFVVGQRYIITFVGTTNFTTIGAASNTVGLVFTATGVGTGTGTATTRATISNVAVASLTIAAGGSFTLGAFSVSADVTGASTHTITSSLASPNTATVTGNLYSNTSNSANVIRFTGTGSLVVVGDSIASSNANCYVIEMTSTGSLSFTGSITGSTGNPSAGIYAVNGATVSATGNITTAVNYGSGIIVGGATTLAFVGDVTSLAGGTTSNIGISSSTSGAVSITGNLYGNSSFASGVAVAHSGSGVLTITGNLYAGPAAPALASTSATAVRIIGSIYNHVTGTAAIYATRWITYGTTPTAVFRAANNGSSTYLNFYTADNSLGQAAIADVRSGTVYASGSLTGTLAVPSASNVALGVAVDATTGTAVLTAANIRTAMGLAAPDLDTQLAIIAAQTKLR